MSIFLGSLVYMQSLVTLPLAVRADGHGPEIFGLVYAVNPVTVIVLQPIVLWLIDRLAAVPLLAGSSVSTWNVLGEAVEGPLAGERLEPVPHVDTFWFAWSAYQPDTSFVQQ